MTPYLTLKYARNDTYNWHWKLWRNDTLPHTENMRGMTPYLTENMFGMTPYFTENMRGMTPYLTENMLGMTPMSDIEN